MSNSLRLLYLLALTVTAASCRQLLGIEEASVDPALSSPSGGAQPAAGAAAISGSGSGGSDFGPEPSNGGASAGAGGDGPSSSDGGNLGEGGAAGHPGQGGAAGEVATLCERYCDAAMENCQGSLAIYTSYQMCLAVCAVTPEGEPGDGDEKVDSTHCRLEAALSAGISEPEHSCPIAAPGGNGSCGSNCESLCRLRDAACTEWLTGDSASCLQECTGLEDLGGYTTDPEAMPLHTRGPHVQCRLYHASAAVTDDPETHCQHVDGASPCIQR